MILSGPRSHSQLTAKEELIKIVLLGNIYLNIEVVLRNAGGAGLYKEINLLNNS